MDISSGLPEYFKTAAPYLSVAIHELFQQMHTLQSYTEKIPTDTITGTKLVLALQQISADYIALFTNSLTQWQEQHKTQLSDHPTLEQIKLYQNELTQLIANNHQILLSNTNYQQKFGELANSAAEFYLEQRNQTTTTVSSRTPISIPSPFTNTCEREIIFQEDRMTLYRYTPITQQQLATPLLIIYAFVNRHNILDLQHQRSLIEKLLLRGIPIYLIDWGDPITEDCAFTLDHYLNSYMKRAVTAIAKAQHVKKINLLGVCQGGVLTLCYSALFTKHIQNLITMVTPVDFQTPENILGQLAQNIDADLIAKACGNIPGFWMAQSLLSLRPFRLLQEKYQTLLQGTASPEQLELFQRMEYWMHDCPDHPGALFSEFVKEFYQKNKLIKQQLKIGRRKVNLNNIKIPLLNIYAQQDHLVPPSAAQCLKNYVGTTDYQEVIFSGGHIGVFTSSTAQQQIPDAIFHWLEQRDGSQ